MEEIDGIDVLDCSGNATTEQSKKKQLSQRIFWHFRFSNYEKSSIDVLDAIFKDICVRYVFQEELGKQGTPHLQGAIQLKKAMRYTEFSPDKRIHWEPQKTCQNMYYCCKSDTRNGVIKSMNVDLPKELKLITPSKPWQLEILEIFKTEPNDRTVHWFWSEHGGVGKSSFAKYCVVKENCLFFEEGKKADIMNLIFTAPISRLERIIIDIPRANCNNISYKSIESIKNGLIYSSKYEGGYKYFNPPHIIIFCNFEPQYDKLSADRWHVVNIDD